MSSGKQEKLDQEWNHCFSKKFQIWPCREYEISECRESRLDNANYNSTSYNLQQEDDNLQKKDSSKTYSARFDGLKTGLNQTKSLLDSYDIAEWGKHTEMTNLCSHLPRFTRKEINAELCTKAWLKFATIINSYDIVCGKTPNIDTFSSVHLCEAPGAFVTCMNHHLSQKHPATKWKWIATTLNPYYDGNSLSAMISHDVFIRQTLDNWEFGADFTGNIMDIKNLKRLEERCSFLEGINLVTADGSFDCSHDPGRQEVMVYPLIYWEVVTALNILSKGGNFVIKVFTVLEQVTIALIYLLCWAFEEVHFFKPGPSKQGNSEVYIVCRFYHGQEELGFNFMETLMKSTKSLDYAMTLVAIDALPKAFLEKLYECQEFFISHQIDAIKQNIKHFLNMSKARKKFIHSAKEYFCEQFLIRFNLERIESKCHIGNTKTESYYYENHSHNFIAGSFSERRNRKRPTWDEKKKYDGGEIELGPQKSTKSTELQWYMSPESQLTTEEMSTFELIQGKRFTRCESNLFCPTILMLDLFSAREMFNAVTEFEMTGSGCKLVSPTCGELTEIEEIMNLRKSSKVGVFNNTTNSDVFTLDIADNVASICPERVGIKRNQGTIEIKQSNVLEQKQTSPANSDVNGAVLSEQGVSEPCCEKESVSTDVNYPYVIQSAELRFNSTSKSFASLVLSREAIFHSTSEVSSVKVDALICSALLDNQAANQETSHVSLLMNLIITLKILKEEGVLICKIGDLFSSFNIGVVYIMSRVFKKIAIFKPLSSSDLSSRYIVCCGFQGVNQNIINYLQSACKMQADTNNQFQIIHLVPIQLIFQRQFFIFLRDIFICHANFEIEFINKEMKK